jgi:hypothetical protein
MSIFKNRRLDLKIQYIIIIHSLDLVKWSRIVTLLVVLLVTLLFVLLVVLLVV